LAHQTLKQSELASDADRLGDEVRLLAEHATLDSNNKQNNMIDIETVSGFWYDGNTPIAELVDGREVVLSEEDAQHILDWTASIAATA
jgi:hypothetical protein